ncbi:SDR family NAD(P)-dependent oxidoreductase [Kocuria massiliensis]|uniref:SDR family NAD(P)-dependent oxidoreductase n=1 Tax=Kocuria massiliensis TaxID=1926282 RepID=UPI002481B46B|nr:SDR family NAD(P)-dependent oxidoreductase [Kocuria massiliensis]
MEQTHQGRIAIVTGAASGIGAAIAHHLAERGARIAGVDIAAGHASRVWISRRGWTTPSRRGPAKAIQPIARI